MAVVVLVVVVGAVLAIVTRDAAAPDAQGGATPDIAALAGPLADQTLVWEACEFNEDGPPIPGADTSNVECATIQVPRDWLNPDPELTWDVRISQARNIDPADSDYNTTIIGHPGGPYTSGLSFSTAIQLYTPELRPTTNYVSFDQRGLGQSSRASCEYQYDPAGGPAAAAQAIGEACSEHPDVATMTTEQAAYDMDFMRLLLGLETVTYIGYSYGTWIGAWYGTLFAENIERMVFDSATDSTRDSIQHNYDAAHLARDRQFRLHMLNWIARNDAIVGLGTDPEAIWERYFAATADPLTSLAAQSAWTVVSGSAAFSSPALYPAAGSLVASIIAEAEASTAPVDPTELTARIVARTDLPDALRAIADERLALLSATPEPTPGEMIQGTHDYVIEFTACTDGQWTQGAEHWADFHETTAEVAPLTAQLGLLITPTCAFWPTDSKMPELGADFPETLVVQSELDSMTPYEQGWAAGTGLPNTSLIVVDNESIHGVFPYGTDAVDLPVIEFLLGGDRPADTIVAPGKPLPFEESTYESWWPLDETGAPRDEPQFTDPTIAAETAELSVGRP
ncbi:alpha/beta fold hydrolase [Pseudoclavibacter endophyticus]|uniref:alpha/beta fold hydrolase n=1 Tax=Pseudoclavibacter endophyticus TaxID=1778590 RepID=UPI00166E470D|nr:alpha/beta hydrolase [Pseudoclavibacter endophyticus]